MNPLNQIIDNKYLGYSLCFLGGYALSAASKAVDKWAVIYFDHITFDRSAKDKYLSGEEETIQKYNFTRKRQEIAALYDWILMGIAKDLSYRFLFEKVIVSRLFPQSSTFSIMSLCLLITAIPSDFSGSNAQVYSDILNALSALISSLAQERMGLMGSIFLGMGYGLYIWQETYHRRLPEIPSMLKEIRIVDLIHPYKIACLARAIIEDTLALPVNVFYKIDSLIIKPLLRSLFRADLAGVIRSYNDPALLARCQNSDDVDLSS